MAAGRGLAQKKDAISPAVCISGLFAKFEARPKWSVK